MNNYKTEIILKDLETKNMVLGRHNSEMDNLCIIQHYLKKVQYDEN